MTAQPQPRNSPPWSTATKVILVVGFLLLLALMVWQFQSLIGMIVVAAIIAYLLNPIIVFIDDRTGIRRGFVIVFVYMLLAILIVTGFSALGVAGYQQGVNLIEQAPGLIEAVTEGAQGFIGSTEPILLGPISITPIMIPWDSITEQVLGLAEPFFSQSAVIASRVATVTVRTVINVVFIFFVSIYLASDLLNFDSYLLRLAERPGYREDMETLLAQLKVVWSSYLRGQVLLGLVIFLMSWLGLTALGVQNSLALGLISGLLEFVPTIGPVVSAIIAMIVAFFQPENYLGLSPWAYALAVLGLMILIQQLENSILVPRIVGGALNLHPFIVIVGVFMGASIAGVLGAVLAAPIIASLKVFGNYAWRKLFDLPPFPGPEQPPPPLEEIPVVEVEGNPPPPMNPTAEEPTLTD